MAWPLWEIWGLPRLPGPSFHRRSLSTVGDDVIEVLYRSSGPGITMFTGIITALGTGGEIVTKADGDVVGIMTPWDCGNSARCLCCMQWCRRRLLLYPAAGSMLMFQPKQWR